MIYLVLCVAAAGHLACSTVPTQSVEECKATAQIALLFENDMTFFCGERVEGKPNGATEAPTP